MLCSDPAIIHIQTSMPTLILLYFSACNMLAFPSDNSHELPLQVGVLLSKQLMAIAGHALKANITTLAPLVLPVSEMVIFVAVLFARKVRCPNLLLKSPLLLTLAMHDRPFTVCL